MSKIALIYDDGKQAFLITHDIDTNPITPYTRQVKRKMRGSINKSLAKFFSKIGREIEATIIGDACADIYILYQLGDSRVRLTQDYIIGTIDPQELVKGNCTLIPIQLATGEIPEDVFTNSEYLIFKNTYN